MADHVVAKVQLNIGVPQLRTFVILLRKKRVRNETNKRLEVLHKKHYEWLYSCIFKISKSQRISEDLIQELYLYLAERDDEAIYFEDSFNLQYCRAFLLSRFYNLKKIENRYSQIDSEWEKEDEPYNEEEDERIQNTYKLIVDEIKQMQKQKGWSSAKLAELYWFSDMTFEQLANEIGISKSTAFLNVRKIKVKLKNKFNNPYDEKE